MTPEEIRDSLIRQDKNRWKDAIYVSIAAICGGTIIGAIIAHQLNSGYIPY